MHLINVAGRESDFVQICPMLPAGKTNLVKFVAQSIQSEHIAWVPYITPFFDTNDFIKNYTNKTLSKRMARTNDFNGTVHLLISDLSDYITGATISVDGGWTTI